MSEGDAGQGEVPTGPQTGYKDEYLAFVESVRQQASRITLLCLSGRPQTAGEAASVLREQATKRRRELLSLPEPDPDVDYDPDYHWDGTERLPGEPRREKGDPALAGYDLRELNTLE